MISELIENKELSQETLARIMLNIHEKGPISQSDLEKLSYLKVFHNDIFSKKESELMYLMGLFYKANAPETLIEEIYSIYANSIEEEIGVKFSPIQADAYRKIKNRKFFSFSAPTSSGKSFLFKELIRNCEGDIVIVLPSRALIAEYLKTIKELVPNDVLVLQFIENINILKTKRRIYIVTPERGVDIFKYKNTFNLKLFLFDEAQLSEEDSIRGITFDSYVRRINKEFPKSTKVFAHPFVKNPEAQFKKHNITKDYDYSAYNQNTVGKIFLGVDKKKWFLFSPYNSKSNEHLEVNSNFIEQILKNNGTVLIYASKNKLYNGKYLKDYAQYLKYCPKLSNPNAMHYVDMLRDYIGAENKEGSLKESLMVRLMERGIVIHHGSLPLKARLIIEDFVRGNFARICFATSTLLQGINMPFDVVYVDNFKNMDIMSLKNLIGRAGRSTSQKASFDFGYVVINKSNIDTFSNRINQFYELSETTKLDNDIEDIEEDEIDLVEAIKNNTFDAETNLTKSQLERIDNSNLDSTIKDILRLLFVDGKILTAYEYYEIISKEDKEILKNGFKAIFTSHLRRKFLTRAEMGILSTAIPILLWHIQGKSFSEVLALRFSYLNQRSKRNQLRRAVKNKEMSLDEMEKQLSSMYVRYSPIPSPLPNKKAINKSSFGTDLPVKKLLYDDVVFDTYDYIDKVISLSLSDPLCAAFNKFYEKTNDIRAKAMSNYIRYGTNNEKEIWLLKYGFSFEEIDWVKNYVERIDEKCIIFRKSIKKLEKDKISVIKRYI